MLRLSKKTEYALMAVRYIAMKGNCYCITAKEISETYDIPFELLSKILQKLGKFNIVKSYQGVKGGYSLMRNPNEITLIEIMAAIDPNYNITKCMNKDSNGKECSHTDCCSIRNPLQKIQQEIDKIFRNTTIVQLI